MGEPHDFRRRQSGIIHQYVRERGERPQTVVRAYQIRLEASCQRPAPQELGCVYERLPEPTRGAWIIFGDPAHRCRRLPTCLWDQYGGRTHLWLCSASAMISSSSAATSSMVEDAVAPSFLLGCLKGRYKIRSRLLSAPYQIHTSADEFVAVSEAAGRDRLSRELLQVRRQGDAVHVRIIGQGRATGKVFGWLAREAAFV